MLVLVWLLGIPRSTARHCHSNPPRSQTTVRFLLRLIRCLTFPKAFYGNERNICRYFCSVWFNLLIMTSLWWVMGGCGLLGAQWPGIIWNEVSGHFPVTRAPTSHSVLSCQQATHSPPDCVGDRWIRNDRKIWGGGGEIWSSRRMERKGVSWRGWQVSCQQPQESRKRGAELSHATDLGWAWARWFPWLRKEGTLHNTWVRDEKTR